MKLKRAGVATKILVLVLLGIGFLRSLRAFCHASKRPDARELSPSLCSKLPRCPLLALLVTLRSGQTARSLSLRLGQNPLDGKVTGITKFGAFVSLPGNRSGLVHTSGLGGFRGETAPGGGTAAGRAAVTLSPGTGAAEPAFRAGRAKIQYIRRGKKEIYGD